MVKSMSCAHCHAEDIIPGPHCPAPGCPWWSCPVCSCANDPTDKTGRRHLRPDGTVCVLCADERRAADHG